MRFVGWRLWETGLIVPTKFLGGFVNNYVWVEFERGLESGPEMISQQGFELIGTWMI